MGENVATVGKLPQSPFCESPKARTAHARAMHVCRKQQARPDAPDAR